MSDLTFHPMGDSTSILEVYLNGTPIGMVWQAGSLWHADPFNMQDPEISETDRDSAAAKLAESHSRNQNSSVSGAS